MGSNVLELSEMMSSGLDIFDVPSVDSSIKHGKTIYHHLSTAINENNNIFEFVIPSENHEYTYLPLTRLEGEIQVVQTDNTVVDNADVVCPTNLLASTLWRQVEVELNGVQIADLSSPTYHYKSFIETHLTYGSGAKQNNMSCVLYHKDAPNLEETFDNTSPSYVKRNGWLLQNEGKLQFSTPLHIDFFDSHRFLIPGCVMRIRLVKNEDRVCLMSTAANANAFKIKISKLAISTRRLTIHDDIVERHKLMLLKQPAIYPIAQSKIRTYTINQGLSSASISNIFCGKLPRQAIFGFVRSDAFNGAIERNPFKFQPFGLNYFSLMVNGSPVPAAAFTPDFAHHAYTREFAHFLDHLGIGNDNESIHIDNTDFLRNSCFFPFDFSPDLCNNYHHHNNNSGSVNLDLRWSAPWV